MGMDHSRCAHPRTPAGRAACRKAGGPTSSFTTNVAAGLTLRDPAEAHLDAIRRLARRLMDDHGLTDWRFAWDRSTRRYGECRHSAREIGISRALAAVNAVEQTTDTILHEIAHALCGPGKGHGPEWQRMAIRLGANPNRYYDSTKVAPAAGGWAGTCPTCGYVWIVRRLTERRKLQACTACCRRTNGGRWHRDHVFMWKQR